MASSKPTRQASWRIHQTTPDDLSVCRELSRALGAWAGATRRETVAELIDRAIRQELARLSDEMTRRGLDPAIVERATRHKLAIERGERSPLAAYPPADDAADVRAANVLGDSL